jgi:hypothetical protein
MTGHVVVHIGALGRLNISHEAQIAALETPYAAKVRPGLITDQCPLYVSLRLTAPYQLQVALGFLNIFCLGCTKLSACFLYYRIFNVHGIKASAYTKVVAGSIVLLGLWLLAFLILFGLSCEGHWYALWEVEYHNEYCSNLWTYLYAVSVSDVVLDLWVLALPLVPVCHLQQSDESVN